MLPILHSFACFMPTRANEQMYNNASEKTKIIYVASLAGLLPAGPGHSHQSVRDISIVGSIPGMTLIEPSSEREARLALRYAVEENNESTYIRFASIPVELPFSLPDEYTLARGVGAVIREGTEIVICAYGPVMLTEAFHAANILQTKGVSVKVINLPWLNTIDEKWFSEITQGATLVVSIDDHYTKLGQGVMIGEVLSRIQNAPPFLSLGLHEIPACGTTEEVLSYHHLDAASIAAQCVNQFYR
jgi:transketolase